MSDGKRKGFQEDVLWKDTLSEDEFGRYIAHQLEEELSGIRAGEELIQRTLAAAGREEPGRAVCHAEPEQKVPEQAGTENAAEGRPEPNHAVRRQADLDLGTTPGQQNRKSAQRRLRNRILAAAACAAIIVLGASLVNTPRKSLAPELDYDLMGDPADGNWSGTTAGEGNAPGFSFDKELCGSGSGGTVPGLSPDGEPWNPPAEGSSSSSSDAKEPDVFPDGTGAETPEYPDESSENEQLSALLEELRDMARAEKNSCGAKETESLLKELTGWTPNDEMKFRVLEYDWGEISLSCRVYESGRVEFCLTEQGDRLWYALEAWQEAGRLWDAAQ